MVFVKTTVYHVLDTLMPYPFGGPPRPCDRDATKNSTAVHLRAPGSVPVGREASITSDPHLIHTCTLCDVNPFDYLNALQRHAPAVVDRAAQWLPWNYHEQLAAGP